MMANPEWTNIVFWCAQECTRQRSGEMSVANMFHAWSLARLLARARPGDPAPKPKVADLITLAARIDPLANKSGFRTVPVIFANGGHASNWRDIAPAVARLCEIGNPREEPLEFYKAFEEIHPFQDGNGRLGSILFNWGSLDSPIEPPNLW